MYVTKILDSDEEKRREFSKPVAEVTGTPQTQPKIEKFEKCKPQFANSEFLGKVQDYRIPIVTNLWIGLLARYSLIKVCIAFD